MKKRWKIYTVSACVAMIGLVSLIFGPILRGAPAVDVAKYVQAAGQTAPATELKFLSDNGNVVSGMKLTAQTDGLSLYFNEETAEIAVLVRKSGKIWRSNPENRDKDAIASSFEKERLASQFTLSFRDAIGTLTTFTSFADSVKRKQFKSEKIAGGVRVTYTLGDMSVGIEALPKRISKQRMQEKVLSKLDEATAKYVSNRYFPLDSNPDVLERLDTAVSRALVLGRMLDAFARAGYTKEDLAFDNKENGIAGAAAEDRPNFTVPVDYRLEGDSLVVYVPVGQIQESKGYRILTLELLDFFGAAGAGEQGYMLVPDGSGSLIRLNNGKFKEEVYVQRIYGDDENDNGWRRGQIAEPARLPVFGLKAGDDAWFAVIEKGEGIASVNADVNGRQNSYNYAYASFAIRGEDTLELYKGDKVDEIQLLTESRYEGDLQIRYNFLTGSDASYSGMARLYRNKLVKDGVLKPRKAKKNLPFYVDILGAVEKRKTFLGVPYKGLVPMTTFAEAGEIADKLKSSGVSNLQMRYLGWFNGGLNHKIPERVSVEGKLGGKSGLRQLASHIQAQGGRLYPDVAFQHVFFGDWNFKPASDAARFVTREQAIRYPYNRALNSMDSDLGHYYLLSPAKLPYFVERFISGYNRYGLDSIALRDLGDLLHADYRVNRVVFRDTAKNIVTQQLGKLKIAYPNVMVAGGNAYALRYADQLINIPTTSSGFNVTDGEVPFYEMVLHGYLDYAGSPMNLDDEQDLTFHLLRSVEYGAAPHFLWSYQSSSELKFTPYNTLFSTDYRDWLEQAADLYGKLNRALGGLQSVPIAEHIRVKPDVAKVRYENGTSLYINYTDKPVTVDGVTIEAKNFAVGGDTK
ncbi:MAG TPA: DUF5696 domain-containing protein [Bacilli bacterium]